MPKNVILYAKSVPRHVCVPINNRQTAFKFSQNNSYLRAVYCSTCRRYILICKVRLCSVYFVTIFFRIVHLIDKFGSNDK